MTQQLKTFQDSHGRVWDLTLNLGIAKRIDNSDYSALTDQKFSILKPDRETLTLILTDESVLFAVIWTIVVPQAKKMHQAGNFPFDPETQQEDAEFEFVSGINSAAKEAGKDAFYEALSDFFPERRTAFSTLRSQFRKLDEKLSDKLKMADADLDKMVDEQIEVNYQNLKERMRKTISKRPQGEPSGETSTP